MVKLNYKHPLPEDADPMVLEPYRPGDAQRSLHHVQEYGQGVELIILEWTYQIIERNPKADFLRAFNTAVIWYFG